MLSDFGLQSNPINLKVKSYVSWPPVRFQIQLPWRLLSVLLYTSGVSESSRDLKAVVFSLSLLKRKEKNQQQTQFGIYSHPLVFMGNCFQDPKCKITWIAPKSMDTQIPYYCLQLALLVYAFHIHRYRGSTIFLLHAFLGLTLLACSAAQAVQPDLSGLQMPLMMT